MNSNKFLLDFVKMRHEIAKTAPKSNSKPITNSISTLASPSSDITLGYIISKKPSRKEVVEYFTSRIDELVEEAESV
jgi:hypothetical protein